MPYMKVDAGSHLELTLQQRHDEKVRTRVAKLTARGVSWEGRRCVCGSRERTSLLSGAQSQKPPSSAWWTTTEHSMISVLTIALQTGMLAALVRCAGSVGVCLHYSPHQSTARTSQDASAAALVPQSPPSTAQHQPPVLLPAQRLARPRCSYPGGCTLVPG